MGKEGIRGDQHSVGTHGALHENGERHKTFRWNERQ
jgi:hypothetical protein